MDSPTLGDRLRSDQSIAQRRRDDADQLNNALQIAATLSDQADQLRAELGEAQNRIKALELELIESIGGAPDAGDAEPVEPVGYDE